MDAFLIIIPDTVLFREATRICRGHATHKLEYCPTKPRTEMESLFSLLTFQTFTLHLLITYFISLGATTRMIDKKEHWFQHNNNETKVS